MTSRIRFEPAHGFQSDLRARVDAHFAEHGVSRHGNLQSTAKSIFWLAAALSLYFGLLAGVLPAVFVLVLGFSIAAVGFNVGHEALHGATSQHEWVNSLLGWSFDLLGGSSHTWRQAHNVVHHTYTNMPGVDHDIDAAPWMRFHAQPEVPRYYRWQHVFAFAFYTLTMLAWTFSKDFVQMARGPRSTSGAWIGMLFGKLIHGLVFIAVPLLFYAGPWWQVLVGYVLMQMAVGFTLAIVFQVAHVVEGTTFPTADARGVVAGSWAEHQLHTTANFSTGGALATFVTGGLNHQIEHHLFPKISHVHYAALARIVRRTAQEHGLPYHENESFLRAVASHVRIMRIFGSPVATPIP